jgi:hypothetical protein
VRATLSDSGATTSIYLLKRDWELDVNIFM